MWPVVQTSSVLGQIFDEGIHGKSSVVLRGGLIEIKWDFPQIKALSAYFLPSQHQEPGIVTLKYNKWEEEC